MHDRQQELSTALVAIEDLLHDIAAFGDRHAEAVAAVPAEMRPSATNLAHYLAVRTRDLRGLQARLHALSLSSLGRLEGHVLGTVLGVRTALRSLAALPANVPHPSNRSTATTRSSGWSATPRRCSGRARGAATRASW